MALICNLQADGPLTLRRLRERGCRTLTELRKLPLFELAQALGGDVAFAKRFLREAAALETRLGPEASENGEAGGLEPEEVGAPRATASLRPAAVASPLAVRDGGARRVPGEPLRKPIVMPSIAAAVAAILPSERVEPILRAVRGPSAGTALRPGLLDGLDEEWCRALIGQGVLGLEALRDAPGLALARALGRPLTRLVELQCFAQRKLDELAPAPRALARVPQRASEVEPPPRPVLEPDYTIFPPAALRPAASHSEPRRAPVPTVRREAVETENGIGGPFA